MDSNTLIGKGSRFIVESDGMVLAIADPCGNVRHRLVFTGSEAAENFRQAVGLCSNIARDHEEQWASDDGGYTPQYAEVGE